MAEVLSFWSGLVELAFNLRLHSNAGVAGYIINYPSETLSTGLERIILALTSWRRAAHLAENDWEDSTPNN